MKNTTLFAVTALLCSLLISCETKIPTSPDSVQGYWQSVDDAKSLLRIDGENYIEIYDGRFMASSSYEFQAEGSENCAPEKEKACLSTKGEEESMTYIIMEASDTTLAMYALNTNGQPLAYKKVDAFEIPKPQADWSGQTVCFLGADTTTDNYSAEFTFNENEVTGYLTYQKEGQHTGLGSFAGTLDGEIISGIFTFYIEGDTGQEEAIFKIEEERLYEGGGERTENEEGVLIFKDKSKLEYTTLFIKKDCSEVAEAIGWAKELANSEGE